MPGIYIVTDSSAHFRSAQSTTQFPITVVPNRLQIGSETFLEGVDLDTEAALELIGQQQQAPRVIPPSTADFVEVYSRLARDCEAIISIHASREMSASWQNARIAAQQVMGQTSITVIDSQTLCAGQAVLVQLAARLVYAGAHADEIVRQVRGAIDRLYAVYYVSRMDFLLQNQIMSRSHAILGAMLGIKPFLTIENGRITPIEKVKTYAQAIDRLVEFAGEFEMIEEAIVLYHKSRTDDYLYALNERLAQVFPDQAFQQTIYSPSLAALIGADGMGMIILEKETEL